MITVQVWNTIILSNKPSYTIMVQLFHRKSTKFGRSVLQFAETSAGYKHLQHFSQPSAWDLTIFLEKKMQKEYQSQWMDSSFEMLYSRHAWF